MDRKSIDKFQGKFIAFEGIDGSGKSTQISKLIQRITLLGQKCFETKEPTNSPIGSLIRQIMEGRIVTDNRAIASLFIADRIHHLLNKTDGILQKIQDGTTVITDRYYFSSYAYHGVDMDMDWVIQGNSISADILRPTVTIFLDVPVPKALERISRRGAPMELFEKEERLIKVRNKYFEAFEKLRGIENVIIINGDAGVDVVAENVWKALSPHFRVLS